MFAATITDQFKLDMLKGVHQPGDVYRIALYLQAAAADKNRSAVSYNSQGELLNANGYKRGGLELSGFAAALVGGAACLDWNDPSWPEASFTADAAVIYNASRSNKILAVLAFPPASSTNGPFTVVFPDSGIIQIP